MSLENCLETPNDQWETVITDFIKVLSNAEKRLQTIKDRLLYEPLRMQPTPCSYQPLQKQQYLEQPLTMNLMMRNGMPANPQNLNSVPAPQGVHEKVNNFYLSPDQSSHPIRQKRKVVDVTRITAEKTTFYENREESKMLATEIPRKNGYQDQWEATRNTAKSRVKLLNQSTDPAKPVKHILPIPFVSDQILDQARKSLNDVCKKGNTCRVCPTLGEGACGRKGGVYQLTCECGEMYIGETGRPLGNRIDEHMRAASNPQRPSYSTNAVAKHCKAKHEGKPVKISLKLMAIERNTSRRKALEAMYIYTLNPSLNGQAEVTDLVTNFGVTEMNLETLQN